MSNEQILNERWENINKYLLKYLKSYMTVNQKTKDNIQNLFNELDIEYTDINKPIPKSKKNRVNRFIQELKEKGLLKDYFGYKARLIYSKKNITYLEMLEIMLMGIYVEENKRLDEYTNLLFYEVCKDSYEKGIKDIGTKKPISFKNEILYTILNIPIFNMTAKGYLQTLTLTNADEVIKKTLNNIQLGKELDVDNKMYQELFNKINNRLINVNGDKISGGIENIVENIANDAYLQAGIDTNTKECRFVAITDKRTTKMCESLNNQIFKLSEMNVYQRYSDGDGKVITYHTKGLVKGENLPPINNHFHWCRSTITYQLEENKIENLYYTDISKYWRSKSYVNRNAKVAIPKENDVFIYKGKEYIIDGKSVVLDYNNEELELANWLCKKINKKINMVPRVNYPFGIKTPDYIIKNMYFDLKTINGNSSQTLYHAVRNKSMQSNNFIFDVTNSSLDMSDILNQINTIYKRKDTQWVNIIMIKKDNNLFVYERH